MALAVTVAIRTHPRLNEKRVTVHDDGREHAATGALVTLDFSDWCLCRRPRNDLDADCDCFWAEWVEAWRVAEGRTRTGRTTIAAFPAGSDSLTLPRSKGYAHEPASASGPATAAHRRARKGGGVERAV